MKEAHDANLTSTPEVGDSRFEERQLVSFALRRLEKPPHVVPRCGPVRSSWNKHAERVGLTPGSVSYRPNPFEFGRPTELG